MNLDGTQWWRHACDQISQERKHHPGHWTACRKQADLIGGLEDERIWEQASWISLSRLANDLGQVMDKDRDYQVVYRQALARISQWVAPDHHLGPPNSRSLAALCGGLSKGIESQEAEPSKVRQCTQGLLRIAREMRAWAERERRYGLGDAELKSFSGIDLAQLCNGLSKLSDQVKDEGGSRQFRLAMGEISRAVVHRAVAGTRLSGFEARHLAMLANGLGKVEGDADCSAGLSMVGREVHLRANEGGLRDFKEHELTMLAGGLCKTAEEGNGAATGLTAVGAEMKSRVDGEGRLLEFDAKGLAVLANALAKLEGNSKCAAGLRAVGREVELRVEADASLREFNAQELAMLVNGLGKVAEERDGAAGGLRAVGRALALRLDRDVGLPGFNEKDLAMLAGGLSKLDGDRVCEFGLIALSRATNFHVNGNNRLLRFEAQDLAMLAHGIGKVYGDIDCASALKSVGHEVELRMRERGRLSEFKEAELTMLVNGLGKMEGDRDCAVAVRSVGKEVELRMIERGRLPRFKETELAMLANELGKVAEEGSGVTHGLREIGQEVALRFDGHGRLPGFEANHLAILARALSKEAEEGNGAAAGLRVVSQEITLRVDAQGQLPEFNAQDLAMLALGLGKLEEDKNCTAGLNTIGRALMLRADKVDRLPKFNSQDLAMLAIGLCTAAEDGNAAAAGLSVVGRAVMSRVDKVDRLPNFNPQDLAMLREGLGKLKENEDCAAGLRAVNQEVERRTGWWRQVCRQANLRETDSWIACRDQAQLIGTRDDKETWSLASWIDLSSLANDFGEGLYNDSEHQSVYHHALARIGRWIATDGNIRNPYPRSLAGLSRGLSRGLDAQRVKSAQGQQCAGGLLRVAREVKKWAERERRQLLMDVELAEFSEIDLAQLCNGLAKIWDQVKDEEQSRQFQPAMNEIAKAVAQRAIAGHCLDGFKAKHLAMLANGLGKVEKNEHCIAGLSAVGQEVVLRADSETGLSVINERNLALLANGLGKAAANKECAAALNAVGQEVKLRVDERGRLPRFNERDLAMLASGLGKSSADAGCAAALSAVGQEVKLRMDEEGRLTGFGEQDLVMLASGFGNASSENECAAALNAVGLEVEQRVDERGQLPNFINRDLSMLANGFGKSVEDMNGAVAGLRSVGRAMALRIDQQGRLPSFNEIDLAMLANGLGKLVGEEHCAAALSMMGREVKIRAVEKGGLSGFEARGLAMLANGLGKIEGNEDCSAALSAVGLELNFRVDRQGRLLGFDVKQLAMLANGLGKAVEEGKEEGGAAAGLSALGREVELRANGENGLPEFDANHLAMLVNGLSKPMGSKECSAGLKALGREVALRMDRQGRLLEFKSEELAMLANGFGKMAKENDGAALGLQAVGREIDQRVDELGRLPGITQRNLAMLANGLGKLDADEGCMVGLKAVNSEVVGHTDGLGRLRGFSQQQLAMLAYGFSCRSAMHCCKEGMSAVAQSLGAGGYPYAQFGASILVQLANSLSRHVAAAQNNDEEMVTLMQGRLHELTAHMIETPARIWQFSVSELSVVLKALGNASLYDDLALLCPPALERLEEERKHTEFRTETLGAIGNLCAGLLPLLLTREPGPRRHRRQVLEFLERMQPAVKRKIELSLAEAEAECRQTQGPQDSSASAEVDALAEESWRARQPGRSIHLALKTYETVCEFWRVRFVGGPRRECKRVDARRQELKAWLHETANGAKPLLDHEFGVLGAAALRARLEDPSKLPGSMDRYLLAHADEIKAELERAGQYPAPIDLEALASEWDHPPSVPTQGVGPLPPLVNLYGQEVARASTQDSEPRFTMLARLGVPVIEVQLDNPPGLFALERPMYYQGVPYLFNLFGGSALVKQTVPFDDVLDPSAEGATRGPKLVGVRVRDLLPDAPFRQALPKLFTYKEGFWYFQRMMKSSPPEGIPGLGPADHVLEGKFPMTLMLDQPDRPRGIGGIPAVHPFQMIDAQGRSIALQPYDGCGFIKASVAECMPAYRRALGLDGSAEPGTPVWKMAALAENKPSDMSLSALQHYGPDEAVAQEAVQHLQKLLPTLPEDKLRGETLFRCAVNGLMQGKTAILVASADGRAHLPRVKSEGWDGGDVLVGKSPFDKANLLVLEPWQIGTEDEQDVTAQFLGNCGAFQHSYKGVEDKGPAGAQNADGEPGDTKDTWLGMKGVDIVVPDVLWPKAYARCDRVGPVKDVKLNGQWIRAREPAKVDTDMLSRGAYSGGEVYAPGSLMALPLEMIKRLDADCDGDTVQLFMGRPELCRFVKQVEQQRQANPTPSFKPPKTFTPAIDAETGVYDLSRTQQIVAIYKMVIQTFTGLQVNLLAQKPETQQWIAERAVLGTYEGMDGELLKGVWEALEADDPMQESIERLAMQAAVDKKRAHYEPARQMAKLLHELLRRWSEELGSPSGASDALLSTLPDGAVTELLPHLKEAWGRASSTTERIEVVLDNYPRRRLNLPEGSSLGLPLGYDPADLLGSLKNLLSIGIKVGTDAYKSDTATQMFSECGRKLKALFMHAPGRQWVPYTKASGRKLAAGRLDAQETLDTLRGIPTLAAQVMHRCTAYLVEQGHWPQDQRVLPITDEMRNQALGVAQELRAQAQQAKELLDAQMNTLVKQVGATLALQDQVLKSTRSLSDDLLWRLRNAHRMGQDLSLEQATQQVGKALRYVVEAKSDDLTGKTREMLDKLENEGYVRVRIRNSFLMNGAKNKGITVQLRAPHGHIFQVEFHTPESLEAKKTLHDLYKLSQAEMLKDQPDVTQRAAYANEMRRVCMNVPSPPGVERILDYDEFVATRQIVGATRVPRRGGHDSATDVKSSTILAHQLHRLAKQCEPSITSAVNQAARILGNQAKKMQKAASTDKRWESIRSKIEQKAGGQPNSPEERLEAASKVLDALRYEFVITDEASKPGAFWKHCHRVLEAVEEQGMTTLRVKNAFITPLATDNPYRGINATFMDARGQAFEVQLHTAASAKAKEDGHLPYKLMQSWTAKGEAIQKKNRQTLEHQQGKMWEAWRAVPTPEAPPGVDLIKSLQADSEVWRDYRERLRRCLSL